MIAIHFGAASDENLVSFLREGIAKEAAAKGIPDEPPSPLSIALKERDRLIGGLYGQSRCRLFLVIYLFVAPDYRQKGWGGSLLKEAEKEACRRHCTHIRAMTNSLEAPGFYARQGYDLCGCVPGYPNNSELHFYSKRLPQPT